MNLGELTRELQRRAISDWTVVERRSEVATLDDARRHEQRTRWTLIVHDDTPDGRGSARLELGANDGSYADLVDRAQRLARAAIGPLWVSRPPAAPAKVGVFDRTLDKAELLAIAKLIRPDGGRAQVTRTEVEVRTAKGLRTAWWESLFRVSAVVGGLTVVREARVREDLGFELALEDAAADVEQLALATPAVAGPCTLILGADALLADGALGVWTPFVAQADAVRARQGLVRYRTGMAIVPDVVEEPLSMASDGALDGGLWSAPMDDEGSAIRRFTMIDRGVAVGLGMRSREAGLTRSEPNGGVRNLVVATGSWNDAVPGGRVIEVRRLDGLEIDDYTGEARLEVALALEHAGGRSRPVAGGAFHLDLIGALARAKRSSIAIRRGPYVGPRAVLIDHAELIA